jgi:hypothetical protein
MPRTGSKVEPPSGGSEQQRLAHEPALQIELSGGRLVHHGGRARLAVQPPVVSRLGGVAFLVSRGFHGSMIARPRERRNEPIGSSCVQADERAAIVTHDAVTAMSSRSARRERVLIGWRKF